MAGDARLSVGGLRVVGGDAPQLAATELALGVAHCSVASAAGFAASGDARLAIGEVSLSGGVEPKATATAVAVALSGVEAEAPGGNGLRALALRSSRLDADSIEMTGGASPGLTLAGLSASGDAIDLAVDRPNGLVRAAIGGVAFEAPRARLERAPQGDRLAVEGRGEMSVARLRAGTRTGEELLALQVPGKLRIDGVSLDADALAAERMSLTPFSLTIAGRPLLDAAAVRVDGLALAPARIALDRVTLAAPRAALVRRPDGFPAVQALSAVRGEADGKPLAQPESAAPDRRAMAYEIGRLEVVDGGRLTFRDESLSSPVEYNLAVNELWIEELDSARPDAASPFEVDLVVGEFSRLAAAGTMAPLRTPYPDFDIRAALTDFSLPSISAYAADILGLRLRQGQLTMDVEMAAEQGDLAGAVDLLLRRLRVEPLSADQGGGIAQNLDVPVETAIALLKRPDGSIRLEVPVSGDLASPSFDPHDAIVQALAGAIRQATIGVISLAFQGATLPLSIIGRLVGADGKIQIDPVHFGPASAELTAAGRSQLDKVAGILTERPATTLTLCGTAGADDLAAMRERARRAQEKSGRGFFADLFGRRDSREAAPAPGAAPTPAERASLSALAESPAAPPSVISSRRIAWMPSGSSNASRRSKPRATASAAAARGSS